MSERTPILLDGVEGETIPLLPPGRRVLGGDPFTEPARPDPFLARLPEPKQEPARTREAPLRRPTPAPPRPGRRGAALVADLDPPEPQGWLERLVDGDALRRVSALAELAEAGSDYDRFGMSPRALRNSLPFFLALYRGWFRVQAQGHEHLPRQGGAVVAGNHAGLLPFDGAMAVLDVLLHSDPPRLLRTVVDRWGGSLPWVNVFLARVGQVVGTRRNLIDLLRDEQLVLVFPEGMDGARKPVTQRYRLQHFRKGFVEEALRARVPIVPMAIAGSDDQTPILYDVRPLARLLGLPSVPLTPTFPWLGPLGLLPYPVRYRIAYGEPLEFHTRFGPEDAEDPRLVRYLANQVRRAVQQLLDRTR